MTFLINSMDDLCLLDEKICKIFSWMIIIYTHENVVVEVAHDFSCHFRQQLRWQLRRKKEGGKRARKREKI